MENETDENSESERKYREILGGGIKLDVTEDSLEAHVSLIILLSSVFIISTTAGMWLLLERNTSSILFGVSLIILSSCCFTIILSAFRARGITHSIPDLLPAISLTMIGIGMFILSGIFVMCRETGDVSVIELLLLGPVGACLLISGMMLYRKISKETDQEE